MKPKDESIPDVGYERVSIAWRVWYKKEVLGIVRMSGNDRQWYWNDDPGKYFLSRTEAVESRIEERYGSR